MRPWYKKKRWWAAGLLLIIIVAAAGGGAGSDNSKPTASETSQASQSEKPAAQEKPAAEKKPEMTSGQKNALQAGQNYVDTMPFSKADLIQQLSSAAGEDFTPAQARYAVSKVY
jgi:hypothetical protein